MTCNSRSRRARPARDVRHDRDGALADDRDRHRVGAYAVACDAAGSVGDADEGNATWELIRRTQVGIRSSTAPALAGLGARASGAFLRAVAFSCPGIYQSGSGIRHG